LATNPLSQYQIYTSLSNDPFLNLSIEHFLLQKSPVNSTVLFLYTNRPCVVIGRNQNPWLEADLRLLARPTGLSKWTADGDLAPDARSPIDLVRRRSGGGAVFHDAGNVNYSVICPPAAFSRDKHAEMVVGAIRRANNGRARVNERHDIVLDQGELRPGHERPGHDDMHRTAYGSPRASLKVSGSAYKLTRQRALHHGTCLVNSPNMGRISDYLRSPARHFIKGRGTDSVRSPVGNLFPACAPDAMAAFRLRVMDAFVALHGVERAALDGFGAEPAAAGLRHGGNWVSGALAADVGDVAEIRSGVRELMVRSLRRCPDALLADRSPRTRTGSTARPRSLTSRATRRMQIREHGRLSPPGCLCR
jgi:lipoate-protein ligase A